MYCKWFKIDDHPLNTVDLEWFRILWLELIFLFHSVYHLFLWLINPYWFNCRFYWHRSKQQSVLHPHHERIVPIWREIINYYIRFLYNSVENVNYLMNFLIIKITFELRLSKMQFEFHHLFDIKLCTFSHEWERDSRWIFQKSNDFKFDVSIMLLHFISKDFAWIFFLIIQR